MKNFSFYLLNAGSASTKKSSKGFFGSFGKHFKAACVAPLLVLASVVSYAQTGTISGGGNVNTSCAGSANVLVASFSLAQSGATNNAFGFNFTTTAGSSTTVSAYYAYLAPSTGNSLTTVPSNAFLLGSVANTGAGTQTIPTWNNNSNYYSIASGTTYYVYITANVLNTAAVGSTITVSPINATNFSWASGESNGTNTATSGTVTVGSCPCSQYFSYNGGPTQTGGSVQNFVVPTGCTQLTVQVAGAVGGTGGYTNSKSYGGNGGVTNSTLAVIPGSTLFVYVGNVGNSCIYTGNATSGIGGSNSGGGATGGNASWFEGGGGGGASDIRTSLGNLATRCVIAGGGGGGSAPFVSTLNQNTGGIGGNGAGSGGGLGQYNGAYSLSDCGAPGTFACCASAGSGGTTGALGAGGNDPNFSDGGGGGGGYYGAGGAGNGGACGGSSFATNVTGVTVSNTTYNDGANVGSGYVIITPSAPLAFAVTGGGPICTGGLGVHVGLANSVAGVNYQLKLGAANVNSPVVGTGSALDLGAVTVTGTYTVVAYYTGYSGCTFPQTGSVSTTTGASPVITGNLNACSGLTTTLNATPSGGTWVSGATSSATVNSTSGVVTGVTPGTVATITYTSLAGCPASAVVTVNLQPSAITGTTTVCGSLTTTLSDATGGGTWSSSNTALATVGSSSGTVTGVGAGNPTITYTASTGCTTTTPITVNPLSAIGGVPSVCNGLTTTVTDATPGGTWTSSNPSVATIGSTTGVVSSVSIGFTTVSYIMPVTGCTATVSVAVTGVPGISSVTGGGSFCTGGTGVSVGLAGSTAGVIYQLFNGATAVGPAIIGSGLSVNFGLQTLPGTYGVVADPGTGCATPQSGSATVSLLPLPTPFPLTATGGGSFCAGGAGQHIILSSSTIGSTYQLFNSLGTPIGVTMLGTSGSIDFGAIATAGTYNVVATNTSTGCVGPMANTVTITVNPLPAINTVTGGGGYCFGNPSTISVGLNGSVSGISYQLLLSGVGTGTPQIGTGSPLSFGTLTTPGTYTVLATNTSTGCSVAMTGSATVAVNALPTIFTMTGGGSYCTGPVSVHAGLNGSTVGVNYQLLSSGTALGSPLVGTGFSLDFGALPAGSYTVSATNGTTGCSVNMSGSVSITVNPLPTPYIVSVTNGGTYCAGSTGPHVLLSSSSVGTTYTLLNGSTPAGAALSGTGSSLDFGAQSAAGSYSVTATTTATGCVGPMSGTVSITISGLPTSTFSVTGGGSYCFGGTGKVVGLSGSTSGISYQLFANGVASGSPITGTGAAFLFPSQTTVGSYTVVGTNTGTTCSNNMTGSVSVSTTPLPIIYNITGGGGYCAGTTTGVHIGLAGSDVGITYQLKKGATNIGAPVLGIGGPIDFGTDTAGSYTVVATNATTLCTSNMAGTAVVFINPLPTNYPLTSTGGSYCLGGAGVPVSITGSDVGTNYRLLNGGIATGGPVAGTGALLNFGNQTAAGNYTVVATNASTGCSNTMTGTANIAITSLPLVYTVTSVGTTYCAGGTGVQIGLSSSSTGVTYQLYNGAATVPGANLTGTGAALNFGLQAAGVYTVVATNGTSFCTNVMSGTINVTTTPLPALYTIAGGGNYCSGGIGVPVSLSGSNTGINYQLKVGASSVGVPMAGTGSSLNFGPQTAAGAYTIVATNTATGCTSTMTGTATVGINTLPVLRTVMGGGNYCPGGAGVDVSIDGSTTGVSYQLYDGAVAIGSPWPGTGAAIDFGLQTAAGTYTVVAVNTTTTCTATMTGSATVSLSPLPTLYSVTGGGNYCPASAGSHVGLSGSTVGVNYQLIVGGSTLVGAPLAGTGLPLDFGAQTAGVYTVVAMSTSTSCSSNMSGSATVNVNALPNTYNITGGGNTCVGSAGLRIGLDGSDVGNTYQLLDGITAVGAPLVGTGFALDFGLQTNAGTYTIVATSTSTGCTNVMTGSVAIIVNPLPTVFTVSGGGNYCAGAGGVHVGLLSSQSGVSYQLYNGLATVGLPMAGTGFPLDFGAMSAAGIYTVVATNNTTACSSDMFGTAVVVINALPTAFTVAGGGNYCPGGTGNHVSLTTSTAGISYQLYNGFATVGSPMIGTGASLDFGLQTAPGTYSVVATNIATGCINNMSNTVSIGINPSPAVYTVSSSASQYCAGGGGVALLLSNSDVGINYQLYVGSTPAGSPMAGTGFELNFGLETAAGTYTVVATNATTGCTINMASSATIVINPLPTAYSVVGGGNYCPGGTGVHIGLAGSHTGISYQLFVDGSTPVGSAVFGTGFAIDFGLQTGAGTYTVVATNSVTTCVNSMAGSATIGINTLPTAFSITGGGNYCATGTGVDVSLTGSNTGVTYQLYNGGSLIGGPLTGTGSSLDFGLQTGAGAYTIVATNATTGCTNNMAGTVNVVINSLPPAFAVTGGGNYCPGGSGVHVGIFSSNVGVNYQLFNGTLPVGAAIPGTGLAVDFGLQTTAGVYTVVGTNTTTGCSGHMSGSVLVVPNTPPVAFTIIGGGNYCASGIGANIGLNSSASGVSYQLFDGGTPEGSGITGTGGPIDFGPQTATGTYTVVGTNLTTGCAGNMAGTATITVSPAVTPSVTLTTTDGDTVCGGSLVTVNATVTNGGAAPTYSWTVNGAPVVSASGSYSYTPVAGDIVGITFTSSAACATPAIVNASLPLTVQPRGLPSITIAANANPVCQGTSVAFTPTTAFGGTAPTISWVVNGTTFSAADIYTYVPANHDVVSAVLTSNYHCRLATTASSNSVTMEVDASVTPAVVVNANPSTHVQQGQVIELSAVITNSVIAPSYQWLLNGEPISGATQSTFTTSSFANLDSFSVIVVSGGGCAGMTGGNGVTIHTTGVGVQQITSAGSDIKLVPNPNKGIFTIKGNLGTTDDQEVSLEVSDMLGQVIYKDKVMVHGGVMDQKVQLSNALANGMYILNLRSESANEVFHVAIEQ